jgi:hypothetical protein
MLNKLRLACLPRHPSMILFHPSIHDPFMPLISFRLNICLLVNRTLQGEIGRLHAVGRQQNSTQVCSIIGRLAVWTNRSRDGESREVRIEGEGGKEESSSQQPRYCIRAQGFAVCMMTALVILWGILDVHVYLYKDDGQITTENNG